MLQGCFAGFPIIEFGCEMLRGVHCYTANLNSKGATTFIQNLSLMELYWDAKCWMLTEYPNDRDGAIEELNAAVRVVYGDEGDRVIGLF